MKLSKIIENIKHSEVKNFSERDIKHVVSDSREKLSDSIFIAVRGLETDGRKFIEDALLSGATAVIHDGDLDKMYNRIVYIKVENARKIQSLTASIVYSDPASELDLTAVTGTNGKTSFSYIYRHIMNNSGKKCCLLGTTEYDLGNRKFIPERTTPDAVFLQRYLREIADSGSKYAVIEVSSHALSLNRVEEVKFDTAVFTNMSHDHLDFHSSIEEYSDVKSTLFSKHLKSGGNAVLNLDDQYYDKMKNSVSCSIKTFSELTFDSDIYIRRIDPLREGTRMEFKTFAGDIDITTNLFGRFQAFNTAPAILTAMIKGVDTDSIKKAFTQPVIIPGRLECIHCGKFRVFVDYAHTPDALDNVLSAVKKETENKLITVFGCGGNRDHDKRSEMGRVASLYSDKVIITDDNPRYEDPDSIIDDIIKGMEGKMYEKIYDRKEAIIKAVSLAVEGDTVIVAGKGHESYQEINGVKYPFSDKDEVKKALGE